MMKIGVLLVNTGTPKKADQYHVAKYLREFLMDPRVIDLPWFIRWPLVNLLIIPTRTKKSTEAYQKIWTDSGSPLLTHSLELKNQLTEKLNDDYVVEIGMRYGQPSIDTAIQKLKQAACDQWIIIPLFPQYASASTGSAIEKFLTIIASEWNIPSLRILHCFYNNPHFIEAYASLIQQKLTNSFESTHLLFSYHGLPQRHITKSTTPCYRTQCFETSKLIAEKLQLTPEQYSTTFQSRLGKTPWIKPYTDEYLSILIQKGTKNLFVACPSFTIDCLETLEEIGVRLQQQWYQLGGNHFERVPCPNTSEHWIEMLINEIVG